MDEAARGGVHKEARSGTEDPVNGDPVAGPETRIRCTLGVIGGIAPAVADRTEVNVVVDVTGGQEAVGDAAEELGGERGPVCKRHGSLEGLSLFPCFTFWQPKQGW